MPVRYFVQKMDVPRLSKKSSPDGEVLETREITRERYEMVERDRDAIERGFDGKWNEAFMTLIQAIESIEDDYRRDAKETKDPSAERELLDRKLVVERILLEAERIKERAEEA